MLFKNIYSQEFFDLFTKSLKSVVSSFNIDSFMKSIYDDEWNNRELKQRMRHITVVLKNHLDKSFKVNAKTILKLIDYFDEKGIEQKSIEFMFLPDFIECYGLEDYQTSVDAFERITQFTSCEFAVRPFITKYQEKMMHQMQAWANHPHELVRRLASEGCRPRLPWGIGLPALKKDPSSILPILQQLKNDPSETVRRSVANNLNDISKDHPDTVIKISKAWKGKTKETDWVVKHACRTLLKQGNTEVLNLFGLGASEKIKVVNLKIATSKVKIGSELAFSFELKNAQNLDANIRLEYAIYYQKANQSLSKKVYKISEKIYAKNSITAINRKQSFKIITTRKFHTGKHQLSIIANGKEFEKIDFELVG